MLLSLCTTNVINDVTRETGRWPQWEPNVIDGVTREIGQWQQ